MTVQPQKRSLGMREKLISMGAQSLSDEELLAAFISSGSAQRSCTQLALDLLNHLGDLRAVLNADLAQFQEVAGLGLVRFVQLQAAREICRRNDYITLQQQPSLTNWQQTTAYLKRQLRDKKNETFAAVFLDNQHRILAYEELFHGTINTASVYSRPIVERIIRHNAAAVIAAHNHPSGLAQASQADHRLTEQLRSAVELVDAKLLDHLVIGDNEVYSIANGVTWPCH